MANIYWLIGKLNLNLELWFTGVHMACSKALIAFIFFNLKKPSFNLFLDPRLKAFELILDGTKEAETIQIKPEFKSTNFGLAFGTFSDKI